MKLHTSRVTIMLQSCYSCVAANQWRVWLLLYSPEPTGADKQSGLCRPIRNALLTYFISHFAYLGLFQIVFGYVAAIKHVFILMMIKLIKVIYFVLK